MPDPESKSQLPVVLAVAVVVSAVLIVYYWPWLSGKQAFYLGDIGLFFEPFCKYIGTALSNGRLPLWNPFPGLGTSQVALASPGIFFPPNWLFAALSFSQALAWIMIFHQTLAAVATYLLCARLRWHPLAGLAAAFCLALNGYMFGLATNFTLVAAAAWLPAAACALAYLKHGHVALAALCVFMLITTGRPELVVPGMGLLALGCLVTAGSSIAAGGSAGTASKRLFWQCTAIALGILLAAPMWLPAGELLAISTRAQSVQAKDMLAWSASLYDLACLALAQPFLDPFGAGFHMAWISQPAAKGYLPFLASAYVGPFVLTLAILAAGDRSWRQRPWAVGALVAALLVATLGLYPGAAELVTAFPKLGFWRYPVKLLYFVVAALALLAARGAHRLCMGSVSASSATVLSIIWALPLAAGLALTMASMSETPVILPLFAEATRYHPRVMPGAVDALMGASLITAAAAGLTGTSLVWLRAANRLSGSACAGWLATLAAASMLACAGTYMRHHTERAFYDHPCYVVDTVNKLTGSHVQNIRVAQLYTVPFVLPPAYRSEPSQPLAAVDQYSRQILEGNTCIDYRIGTLFSYGGLSPAYLERLSDAVTGCCSQFGAGEAGTDLPVARLCQATATGFAVTQVHTQSPVTKLDPQFFRLENEQRALNLRIYRTLACLPRAYVSTRWEVLPSHEAVIDRYLSSAAKSFDPNQVTLLEAPSPDADLSLDLAVDPVAPPGHVAPKHFAWKPEHLDLTTDCRHKALLVVAEPFYPGWHAAIDGQPTTILRANGACRAVLVPAGQHRITFTYLPQSLLTGVLLAAAAALGIIAQAIRCQKQRHFTRA